MRCILIVCTCFAVSTTAYAATIPAGGRIARVVVYADRAEVTRVADVRLPAGASQVEFARLPENVDEDSLGISGRELTSTIGAIELRTRTEEPEISPDLATAEAEIQRVTTAGARLVAEEATDRDLRKYLDGLREATSRPPSDPAVGLRSDTEAFQRMLGFLRSGYSEIAARDLERQAARAKLDEQMRGAQARRAAAAPTPATESTSAIVDVVAEDAGTLKLELTYVVLGPSWQPSYRATLDAAKKQVELVSEASVSQSTGEDWTNVELTLSTAQPAEGLEPPMLGSSLIQPVFGGLSIAGGAGGPIAYRIDGTNANNAVDGGLAFQLPSSAIKSFKLITSGASAKYGEQSTGVAEILQSSVAQTGYSVAYVVPDRSDIASDEVEHRVTLRHDTLPATLDYRVIPSLAAEAYAEATTTAPASRPLLEGPVRVAAGGALVGSFSLAETPPGGELRVPFGADNRIRVTRVELPAANSREGAGNRDRQVLRASRTTLENLRDVPVSITLEERIPVSQDERITVKLGDATTAGSVPVDDRPGVLAWKLMLAPREKRDITLEVSVRHPRDIAIAGL